MVSFSGEPPKIATSSITLTEDEERLRSLLVRTADYLTKRNPESEPVIIRFAGGWVRDKLLGHGSNDIDVAVNSLSGFDFASNVQRNLNSRPNSPNSRPPSPTGRPIKSIHKIKANPALSKHLETATTTIYGLELDFVNLRSEEYTNNSRIPTVKFGTPEEDALRRDCTINTLFYNLHTKQVEDYTHRGLDDLRSKVIRTPLAPFETFCDDPLRVLRCIRFASRLGFEIHMDAKQAMMEPLIKEALKVKISRERIGVEVDKMLKGPDPYGALELIHSVGLYDSVFSSPVVERHHPSETVLRAAQTLSVLTNHLPSVLVPSNTQEKRKAYLLCSLYPYESRFIAEKSKSKPVQAASIVIRDALKFPNSDADDVGHVFACLEKVGVEIEALENAGRDRVRTGLFVKELGPQWPTILRTWLIHQIISTTPVVSPSMHRLQSIITKTPALGEAVRALVSSTRSLVAAIEEDNLSSVHSLKPIVNGKEIANALGIKPGPGMRVLTDNVFKWQLANPEGKGEECLEWLKENQEEHSVPVRR
ncbi:hypothetical protein SAICODRAFT_55481 [Saitoella complicata NRRL Y-17804]|nr:uncharacterized protein SAICODRAFT_55481 [Saitoella complicata NRRL Y-17804]ODQ53995.1 hypothetical protein SAICODRAFT_55481 [Saitoella complicata NRRL Y-17804]